jgi:hypothetical protein
MVATENGVVALNDASHEPVFVLCGGRTGSTLLRFLLDAHPDLACPPETNVPSLCGQLATVWSLIEGAPLSQERGDAPPEIPDAAIDGIRETMERMLGSYLARRGKKRYCDKSLGTARFSYLMQRIWPNTKFICLYRHPMDVIASGLEACPWGLNGYGFDQFIAETPGNSVHALARFWLDNTVTISAAQEEYGERCIGVRYEDMTEDPQATSDALFSFLGLDPVPGIAEACFAAERERFGPADYKIWYTSRISTDSIGRGWTVPAGLIGPMIRDAINEQCAALGYVPVDDHWGTADKPADLRVPIAAAAADGEEGQQADSQDVAIVTRTRVIDPEFGKDLGERLATGLAAVGDDFARRWAPCSDDAFMVVATSPDEDGPDARWWVDLEAHTVAVIEGARPVPTAGTRIVDADGATTEAEEEDETGWDVIATLDIWRDLVAGRTNLSVELRRHKIRYCAMDETGQIIADTRLGMLSDLLGLASWGRAMREAPARDAQPVAG